MILTYEEAKALSTSSVDTLTVIRNTKRAWCIAGGAYKGNSK